MRGSAKLLFPHGSGDRLDAVWLNTAGGVTGGDRFALEVAVDAGAEATLTTQAAERIYRAMPGETGRIDTTLTAGAGAALHWLPQETILYDHAALDRRLRIDLTDGARFCGLETLIFGRRAMGERVRALSLRDRIDLRIDGRLLFADRLRLEGDADRTLAGRFVAAGAGAVATLIFAGPGAGARVDALRAALPQTAGASALSDDLIVARIAAGDGFEMRRILVPLLPRLTGAPLPRPWMI